MNVPTSGSATFGEADTSVFQPPVNTLRKVLATPCVTSEIAGT